MKFLENDILLLRAVEPSDADLLLEVETDSTQWLENGMSAPYSRKNLIEYASQYDADPIRSGQLRLIIESKISNSVIGIADLYDISALNRTAFVGIYILEKERKQNFASEALKLLESYSRQLLNLRILAAKISSRNVASQRLFEKAGYEMSGNLSDWFLSGNSVFDMLLYTLKL